MHCAKHLDALLYALHLPASAAVKPAVRAPRSGAVRRSGVASLFFRNRHEQRLSLTRKKSSPQVAVLEASEVPTMFQDSEYFLEAGLRSGRSPRKDRARCVSLDRHCPHSHKTLQIGLTLSIRFSDG